MVNPLNCGHSEANELYLGPVGSTDFALALYIFRFIISALGRLGEMSDLGVRLASP